MSNTQKFQLTQQGKIYILTTSIDGEFVQLTCHQSSVPNSPKYFGRFSLAQLQQMSKKFNTMTTIYQAQEFLSQSIENQKVSVQNQGNIINIVLYFQQNTQTEQTSTDVTQEKTKSIVIYFSRTNNTEKRRTAARFHSGRSCPPAFPFQFVQCKRHICPPDPERAGRRTKSRAASTSWAWAPSSSSKGVRRWSSTPSPRMSGTRSGATSRRRSSA